MLPTTGQVHIDVGLTDASIQFKNQELMAERFLTPKTVTKISDKIWQYGRDMFRVQNTLRAPGTRGGEGDWSLSTINYSSLEHSWTETVPDQAAENADQPLSLKIDSTEIATAVIQLGLESDTAAAFTSTANYASGLTEDLSAGGNLQWSDPNSDPVGDIEAGKALVLEACGREPNIILLSHKVKLALKTHPKIIARVQYNGMSTAFGGKVTDAMLADLFDLDEILDAKGQKDTNPEGSATTTQYIWGSNAILAVRPASLGLKTVALGALIRLKGYRLTESWYQQPESSTYIRVRDHYTPFLISNLAGFLFQNAIKAGA